MKTNPWFRFYTEAVDDDKLRLIAFEDRWHFVALLCLKGKGLLDSEQDPEMLARRVAVRMGLSTVELEQVAKRLAAVGLIELHTFQPLAWEERQFESDTSKERTRAWRERNKAKRHGDVTVTAQETDTETETEVKEPKGSLSSAPAGLPDCPHQKLLSLWAKHLPHLEQPRVWEGNRRACMKQRWIQASKKSDYSPEGYRTEQDGLEWWDGFFGYIARDTKLSDGFESNGRSWRPTLEWVVNSANFQKIIDGKYNK